MFDKSANMSFVGVGIKKNKWSCSFFLEKCPRLLKKKKKKRKIIRAKCIRASVPDINWTIALDFA